MKLISWNVNGLRACLNKGFIEFFNEVDADIFCVQETKMQEGQVEINFDGYYQYWNSAVKKGYSGVAVFTKQKPIKVTKGIKIEKHDQEGRVLTLEFDNFILVNVYTPNSKRELLRLDYRQVWEDDFKDYLCKLKKPVVVCGDLNVAHQAIDLKNPKSNERNAGYTIEERNKMSMLLESGFVDSYRFLFPDKKDSFTWWSYMNQARSRNIGWRIDYFLVSELIKNKISDAIIYNEILGSDHCPIGLIIEN